MYTSRHLSAAAARPAVTEWGKYKKEILSHEQNHSYLKSLVVILTRDALEHSSEIPVACYKARRFPATLLRALVPRTFEYLKTQPVPKPVVKLTLRLHCAFLLKERTVL